jgi:hypothetical protein
MLEDGGKDKEKWIMVTGNGKAKNLLNPKPKPKLHNAFSIPSHLDAPTYYNVPSPCHVFSAELGGYASKGNDSGDD